MFAPVSSRRKPKSEAERPFWISYADLMTAMMTLCLVVMAVTIISISRKLDKELSADEIRAKEILDICEQIQSKVVDHPGINVNCRDNRIDFGEAGRFDYKNYRLKDTAESSLAALVPVVLGAANSELGRKWLKQVVIEGYTDTRGPYLYNLYLSLQRSYWVMCKLTDQRMNAALGLPPAQVQQVRELFLAGGVSFNDAKSSDEESRRVELRLQFYTRKERDTPNETTRPVIVANQLDKCELQ
jgi:outer membrane protein OmpA-like peptidoglycan-associated protein